MPPSGKTREAADSRDTLLRHGDQFLPRNLICLAGTCRGAAGRDVEIMIHGNRRIPADTIRARMFTKPGDVYDQAGPGTRLQLPVEHRLFRRPAHRARTDVQGLDHSRLREGKADHPRDQVCRLEFGFAERRAGQVQGTKGRADAGEPIRSDQGEARGGGDQAIAGGARPPVRHRARRKCGPFPRQPWR